MTNPEKTVVALQDELPSLIESLRVPAGSDPRFATMELIARNYEAFQAIAHGAWKEIHNRSIDAIMTMEGILSSERRKVMPSAMVFYFERCIQIWRRMNDALIWVLLGYQDHVIRTVCHRKERPSLASANPGPMRKLLENLNTNPQSIAIWTDATTCVDVGDIFCRAPSGEPNGFLEVKEGAMNDKILELLKAKGSPVEIAMHIDVFVQENGPKALKQLERVIRQRTRYNEVLDIVQYEKGYDSRRDAEVIIEESTVALESYDADLQTIIDQAGESPVLRSVDRCLWIYVDRNRAKSPAQKIEDFREALQKTVPDALPWIERNFEGKLPFEAIPLEGNLYTPEAVLVLDMRRFMGDACQRQPLHLRLRRECHQAQTAAQHDMKPQVSLAADRSGACHLHDLRLGIHLQRDLPLRQVLQGTCCRTAVGRDGQAIQRL
jgi:hypothetical protein